MIILGTTFSGKNIVALNFSIECVPHKFQQLVISVWWSVELISIILWSFYYQKLDKNWFPLQAFYFGGGIAVMLIGALFFPESPKYLYSKQKYKEARESLHHIAKINGAKEFSPLFLFENEVVEEEELEQLLILKKEELINKANLNPDLVLTYTEMEFDLIRNSELTQEATIRQQARINKE